MTARSRRGRPRRSAVSAVRARRRSRPRSSPSRRSSSASLFGLIFGASTVYLGLRAGLTVSASIPIAVLAISVLKKLGGSTILENNIVQTIGSAGESVAGGVVFTIPALIFLTPYGPGYFSYFQILMLAFAGGILGVLMMVPLRRALIVKEHGVLPYPEGRGLRRRAGRRRARRRAGGDGVQGARRRRALEGAVVDRPDLPHRRSATRWRAPASFPNATLNVDISPEYMGVGYVIGPRIAGVMFAGGVLSWLVLLPLLSDPRQLHDRCRSRRCRRADCGSTRCRRAAVVERLHPLHRRRRGARVGPHHAGAHDPDDRLVVPRQREGLRRRQAAAPADCAPSATSR